MDLRLLASISAGKITKKLVGLTKTGGTAAPGLVSLKIESNALEKLTAALEVTILVSGTNGKTTTTRLIGEILTANNVRFVHNRHGSNLERGLVSSIIPNLDMTGALKEKIGLFEVDEAVLGVVLPKLNPSVIVLTNLFRDQLDRYGEVDNIKRLWEKALEKLPVDTTLVLNADDPSLAYLGSLTKNKVIYFGIQDPDVALEEKPRELDSSRCPKCGQSLVYTHYYSSHQGDYDCKNCDFTRPKLDIQASNIKTAESETTFDLIYGEEKVALKAKLPGLYNIYNSLAAFAAGLSLNLKLENFDQVLKEFTAVFGRGEKVGFEGREIMIALAKNPTGFNEIIRTFLKKDQQTVLIAINDQIADGRDVSWLWDVNFEKLTPKSNKYIVSGIRAYDMALRLKYAGINQCEIVEDLKSALEIALQETADQKTLTIIPTYTAMLNLKKVLSTKNITGEFWED